MATHVIPTVVDARAAANAWLIDHLPDRFAAGIPIYDAPHEAWRIPVWLSYPGLDPVGPVGELCVDAVRGEVQTSTSLAQMKIQALALYDQHRAADENTSARSLRPAPCRHRRPPFITRKPAIRALRSFLHSAWDPLRCWPCFALSPGATKPVDQH